MQPQTIVNCFLTSEVLGPRLGPSNKPHNYVPTSSSLSSLTAEEEHIQSVISQLKHHGRISEAMNIQFFLNPVGKIVEDGDNDIFEHIVA